MAGKSKENESGWKSRSTSSHFITAHWGVEIVGTNIWNFRNLKEFFAFFCKFLKFGNL